MRVAGLRAGIAGAALAAGACLTAGGAAAAGPAVADLVPEGFAIERRISADIGGDHRADAVLVLVRRTPARATGEDPGPRARRLVMLTARPGGGFAQIGEGRRILQCTRCGGAFFGAVTTPVRVRVRAKVVIVEQESGSRRLTRQRFRIRARGPHGTRLVGVDVRVTDRLTGTVMTRSIDMVTGARIVTRTTADGRRVVRWSRVPVKSVPLERVVRGAYR